MRLHFRLFGTLALLLSLAVPNAWAATAVQLVASDDRGVTLRIDTPAWELVAAEENRSAIKTAGLSTMTQPGRPGLPFATAAIAIPPGARGVARVVETGAEVVRERVLLAPNGKPGFRGDLQRGDVVPIVEAVPAIDDGPWPAPLVELGEVYTLRRQRILPVRILPFQYDERGQRLVVRSSITVRIDFAGARPQDGAPLADRHWDPVLRNTILNASQARAWKARPEPLARRPIGAASQRGAGALGVNAAMAFDEGHEEVRVRTDTSGVYSMRYEDLAAKGYPSGIPVAQVSVHRHEFIENANPAYVTIELPIEVDDANTNGTFDAGDRIILFVFAWAQRGRVPFAQRAWGEGEVVYATYMTDRAPMRMPTRPGWRNLTLTPLASYPFMQRYEKSLFYTRVPPDTNTEQFHWTDGLRYPVTFPGVFAATFETNDPDPTHPVEVTMTWSGTRQVGRTFWADLRNARNEVSTVVDSGRSFGYIDVTRRATLPGTAITDGESNVMRSWGKSDDLVNFGNQAVNWFEVAYWRYFRALEGRLPINSADVTGPFEVRAEGFASGALRVYDVTDSLSPVRLDIDPSHIEFDGFSEYAISFQDETSGERRSYIVFDRPKQVPPERLGAVVRRNLAGSVRSDYLIVAPEAWLPAANALRDLRAAQGHTVLVAPLESVEDEFNGGRHSAYALRRFFQFAFNRWNAAFAVMLGDGSEDPQNLLGDSGPDWMPLRKLFGPVPSGDARELVPSDTWLVSFETPSLPSLYLGRIPANSLEALTAVVGKIGKYENFSADQSWRRRMLLLSDDKYSTQTFFGGGGGSINEYCEKYYEVVFKALSDTVRNIVVNKAGLVNSEVEVFDVNYWLRNEPFYMNPIGDTCRVSWPDTQRRSHATVTPEIFKRINEGRVWWNYQGHANQYVLAHEDLYVNRPGTDDKEQFTNVDKPFLFTAFSCHPNGFGAAGELSDRRGPSIGEDMVMLPDRGAIASWASTGFEILPTPVDRREQINTRFAEALFLNPPRDTTGDFSARTILGEVIAQTLINNWSEELGNPLEAEVGWTYTLLGDPGLLFSIGPPQITVTANGVPVTSGEPVRLFTFGDAVQIEADIASNVAIRTIELEYQSNSGSRIVPPNEYTLTPPFPDTGPGSGGGRRFKLDYSATLAPGSYRYVVRAVDRNGLAITFDVVFEFQTVLRADNRPIITGDPVRPAADLSLLILSPSPIDPSTDMELILNGAPLTFTPAPFNQDTTRREWVLAWSHTPYAPGNYTLQVRLLGQQVSVFTFRVGGSVALENLMAFPNPFDEELGTRFSFTYTGPDVFDLLIKVYTVNGKLIYKREEKSLLPGYHQLPWDGLDAEGDAIANGVYFYTLAVQSPSGNLFERGRLVKLRKPKHVAEEETGTTP